MATLRSMKLDDSDWDALLELSERWGERGRTEVVRRLIAEAMSREPARDPEPTLFPGDPAQPPPAAVTGTVKPQDTTHEHSWKTQSGSSGNLIDVCTSCGERRPHR